jgi:hypothetical protein
MLALSREDLFLIVIFVFEIAFLVGCAVGFVAG